MSGSRIERTIAIISTSESKDMIKY